MSDSPATTGVEAVPRHLRPTTLHAVVLALWVSVGTFTGLGLASVVGAIQLGSEDDLSITEHAAVIGQHAGPWFAVAAIALGAVAVVEAVLLTIGHVRQLEIELQPATTDE